MSMKEQYFERINYKEDEDERKGILSLVRRVKK